MGFTRTSEGEIYKADFSGGTRPTGITDGGAAPTYSVGAADWQGIQWAWMTNPLPGDLVYVTRCKCHMNIAQNVQLCGVHDGSPAGGVPWAGVRPFHIAYTAGSAMAFFANTTEGTKDNAFSAGVSRIFEIASDGTDVTARILNAATAAEIVADTHAYGSAEIPAVAGDPYLVFGHSLAGWGTSGDAGITYLHVFLSNDVTMAGLDTGNAVRLYDASDDSVLASAVESGGSAVLDCSGVDWDGLTCYFKVFTDGTYSTELGTSADYTDACGGDEYLFIPAPSITAVTPSAGYVGDTLVATGTAFGSSQGASTITLSGVTCTVVSWSATSISFIVPETVSGDLAITVSGASDTYPVTVQSDPILRFVDGIEGSTLLDLNDQESYWYLDGSTFPLPEVLHSWAENALAHGKRLIRWRFDDNKITVMVAIKGTSETDLDAKVRTLIKRALKEGWLEFRIWGASGSIFYRTRPVTPKLPQWEKKYVRDAYWATNVTLEIPVEPEARLGEESLDILVSLNGNDNWTELDGGVPVGWEEVEENGGDAHLHESVAETGSYKYYHLDTTAAGDVAGIRFDAFKAVDITKHFCARMEASTPSENYHLAVDVLCYDAAETLLDTLTLPIAMNANDSIPIDVLEKGGGSVIEPADWPAGTTQVKVYVHSDNPGFNATSVTISHFWFGCTEYVVGHKIAAAMGLVIPEGDFVGDVAAKMDVFVDSVHERFTNLLLGQRKLYSEDYDPVKQPTTGTQVWLRTRLSQDYRTIAAITNLVLNSDWATVSGGSGNTTNWANWDETRNGSSVMQPTTDGGAGIEATTVSRASVHVRSDALAPTITNAYKVVLIGSEEAVGFSRTALAVCFYDGATLVGLKTLFNGELPLTDTALAFTIYPEDFPAGTDGMEFALQAYNNSATGNQTQYWRSLTCGVVVPDEALFPLDAHEGRYFVSTGLSFAASNANDDISIDAMLKTADGDEITTATKATVIDPLNPNTKFKETHFLAAPLRMNLPSHRVSSNADLANIEEAVRIRTEDDNAQILWRDHISIIPRCRAATEIEGWADKDHLIFDSRSSRCPLVSLDGTLDTAMVYDGDKWRSPCSFEADPDGVNMTVLAIKDVDGDHQMTPMFDIRVAYYPVVLLVK